MSREVAAFVRHLRRLPDEVVFSGRERAVRRRRLGDTAKGVVLKLSQPAGPVCRGEAPAFGVVGELVARIVRVGGPNETADRVIEMRGRASKLIGRFSRLADAVVNSLRSGAVRIRRLCDPAGSVVLEARDQRLNAGRGCSRPG